MEKDLILQKLRQQGCRITKQRLIILDVILEEDCSSCKEIYYKAVKKDRKIGSATVYRMINTLEKIGAISRKNMYKVKPSENETRDKFTRKIVLDDKTVIEVPAEKWNQFVKAGLTELGIN